MSNEEIKKKQNYIQKLRRYSREKRNKIRKRFKKRQEIELLNDEEKTCANCGNKFYGNYCNACGQSHKNLNRPFFSVIYDFFETSFAFDSKVFKTIPYLLFRPGFLTSEFIQGRRAKYVAPMKFFIFISFILFFIISITTSKVVRETGEKFNVEMSDSASVDSSTMDARSDSLFADESDGPSIIIGNQYKGSFSDFSAKKDSIAQIIDTVSQQVTTNFEKRVYKGLKSLLDNSGYFWGNLIQNASKAMFLLLPVFALFLKLLYVRRKQFYISHLIFSINYHSFSFFILSISLLLLNYTQGFFHDAGWWLIIAIPCYLLIGMKRFYGQRILKTISKFFILIFIYGMVLVLAVGGIFVYTLSKAGA